MKKELSILEERLFSIYETRKDSANFSEGQLISFNQYISNYIKESRYLNPYIFSNEYNIDYAISLSIFLFFANDDKSLLVVRPYIDCLDTDCKSQIFLTPSDIKNNNAYCRDCDSTLPIAALHRQIKVLFEINNDIYNIYKMQNCTNTIDMILANDDGLKHYPPSISHEDMSQNNKISSKDLEGGVSFGEILEANQQTGEPLPKPVNDIQKLISQRMVSQ